MKLRTSRAKSELQGVVSSLATSVNGEDIDTLRHEKEEVEQKEGEKLIARLNDRLLGID